MKLQYKVTIWIFVILLAIGAAGAAAVLYSQRQTAVSQFGESALTLAETLRNSLENDMLAASRERIQDAVTSIARGALINEVVVLSSTQRVYASGETSEIGETRRDEGIARALVSGETVTGTREAYGRSELVVILPVRGKPECYRCHDSEAQILGAIQVGLDRGPLDAQIRNQTFIMVLIGGVAFVAVGGALGLMLRSTVIGPLSVLAASARRIAQGDYGARVQIGTEDEVGEVARTFNEMAERVEQHARALEDSNRELEERVRERTQEVQQMAVVRGQLLERLISAQEEERRRVARGLHDEAGQALTVIMMDLAMAIAALPDDATEAKERLSQSRSLAGETLAELRRLIRDLRPGVLDQLGLESAVRSYVRSRLEAENIQVQLSFLGLEDRLSPQVEITLFRVIQEAVTNIVRHSDASMVNIEVVSEDSGVTATIEDNGKGFDVKAALQAPGSWGLRGIRERIAVVGGELSIESGAGKGTRIQFQIPPWKGSTDEQAPHSDRG